MLGRKPSKARRPAASLSARWRNLSRLYLDAARTSAEARQYGSRQTGYSDKGISFNEDISPPARAQATPPERNTTRRLPPRRHRNRHRPFHRRSSLPRNNRLANFSCPTGACFVANWSIRSTPPISTRPLLAWSPRTPGTTAESLSRRERKSMEPPEIGCSRKDRLRPAMVPGLSRRTRTPCLRYCAGLRARS